MNVAHRLTHTLTISAPTGTSANGDHTYGAQYTQAVRVENEVNVFDAADGTQLAANYVAIGESAIPLESRVWLPGANTADANEAQRVVRVASADTFAGYTLHKAYF